MRKKNSGAAELKKKLDRLTEPEKYLVLAYVKEMEEAAALKDGKRKPREDRHP